MDVAFRYNIIIDTIAIVIIAIVFMGNRREPKEDSSQWLFKAMLHAVGAILLADISTWAFNMSSAPYARTANVAGTFLYYLLQGPFCFFFLLYTAYWTGRPIEELRKRAPLYAVPMIIEMILLIPNLWTGWIYSISADNVYTRSPYFSHHSFIYYTYIVAGVFITLRACFHAKNKTKRLRYAYIAGFMVLPVLGALWQLSFYGISLIWPSVVLSLLMVYINVQQEQMKEQRLAALQMENELTNSRIAIMLSQIQPHFLYNALCVVQDLCYGKAPEAEEATAHFSEFLRGNLDSIKASAPIPFSQELVQCKNYLYLEKLRFNERLNVVYDIQTEDFKLPTLALQPLIENAVRYGVTSKVEGGSVTVATREEKNAWVITVTDDGVGFDTTAVKKDGRSHVGIDNVRSRLRSMCGGDLIIESMPGKGTCAKIILPKETKA